MRPLHLAPAAVLLATPALAHTGFGAHGGFAHGFLHPLLGLDHLLAMVAVGLWAALVGGRAVIAWPAAFMGVMLLGAAAGAGGFAVAGLEATIAVSVVVLGLAVATRASLPLLAGVGICAVFAFAHGFAHGAELPAGAALSAYMTGFSLATALLHGAGVALGVGIARAEPVWTPRLAGSAVALTGLAFLVA